MRLRSLAAIAIVSSPLAFAADPDILAVYGQFRNSALDANRIAVAENLVLKKPAATIQFKSGTLYALDPVLDHVPAVVFIGEGSFTYEPPAGSEQRQLTRFTSGQPRLEEPFKEAVLFFTDSTFTDLSADARFKPAMVDPHATALLNEFRKSFRNDLRTNIEARVLAGLLSDRQPYFLADIHGQQRGRLVFSVDSISGESVSLLHFRSAEFVEEWSSFNPNGSPSPEQRALVHTTRIDLDTEVDKRGKMDGQALSQFTALEDGPRMLYVQLAPSLRVSKVSAADGSDLRYIQEARDKDADFWVILPKPLTHGEMHSWKLTYAGDGVVRKAGGGNYFVGERDRWYPKLDVPGESFNDRSMYHMRFRNPKDLILVATGKPVSQEKDGKPAVSEWETEVPYTVVGFNYGDYKTKTQKNGDQNVTVYANSELGDELKELQVLLEENPQAATAMGITTGGLSTTGIMNRTLAESVNALRLFTAYFGPLPFQNIAVTQQPAGNFGQSWPGLIFMPYTSFLDDTIRHQLHMDEGRSRQFFQEVGSHEISHQWWGHLVSWHDYHDQWLSEGFAQFSAGLYVHRAQGEKKFRTFLEADRDFILSTAPGATERANDAGPIYLGRRLAWERNPGGYRLVYAKGAFVLHMLRMMMYDNTRDDDSRFIAMMRDFVKTYSGKGASTADFKAICDKHFGQDMGWFFDQWVYGTNIPKISIEYSVVDSPDGAVLKLDATQRGVPDGFRSVLPVVLHNKNGVLSGKLTLDKPTAHSELKLKEKPDSVDFNALYGLLCELDVKKR